MKKYNQVIKVEVSVDQIADKLAELINPEFKHKDNVVDSIIGPLLEQGNINYLYNALNGYTNDLDFQVGDNVHCTAEVFHNKMYQAIGEAVVVEVNPYKPAKIRIKHTKTGTVDYDWVDHTKCSKISLVKFNPEPEIEPSH